jgi:hypothetical protein
VAHCRTFDIAAAHILDFRPKAGATVCAKMAAMNPPSANPIASPPRRFMLLPEQGDDVSSRGPRIRRYRLASVSRRSGVSEIDVATAQIVRELSLMGHR